MGAAFGFGSVGPPTSTRGPKRGYPIDVLRLDRLALSADQRDVIARDADERVEGMKGQLHQQFDQIRRQTQCREGFPLAEGAIAETRTRFRGERHAVVGRDDVNPVHGWA